MAIERTPRQPTKRIGRPVRVKCYAVGCRNSARGFVRSDGGFYNLSGVLVANLREQDFACGMHGISKPAFLYRDTDAGKRSTVTPRTK